MLQATSLCTIHSNFTKQCSECKIDKENVIDVKKLWDGKEKANGLFC